MASIIPVAGGYRATVTRKRIGFRQSKTFKRKRDAAQWGAQLETQLDLHGAPEREPEALTIGDLIEQYIRRHQAIKPIGRGKYAALKLQLKFGISQLTPGELTQQVVMDHIDQRRAAGTGGATINIDLAYIRTVLRYHGIAQYRSAIEAIDDARVIGKQVGSIMASAKRDRRPTDDELIRLTQYLRGRKDWLVDIVWFAIYSTRRQNEIAQLLVSDNDPSDQTGMVRGLKDPQGRELNERFKYTSEAWEIVQRQPQHNSGRIFPKGRQTIGYHFRLAVKFLEIEDLRFHDLRHEAVSRLFEQGMSIPDVALHSLHKQWSTLQRYANLNPGNVGREIVHLRLEDVD